MHPTLGHDAAVSPQCLMHCSNRQSLRAPGKPTEQVRSVLGMGSDSERVLVPAQPRGRALLAVQQPSHPVRTG